MDTMKKKMDAKLLVELVERMIKFPGGFTCVKIAPQPPKRSQHLERALSPGTLAGGATRVLPLPLRHPFCLRTVPWLAHNDCTHA